MNNTSSAYKLGQAIGVILITLALILVCSLFVAGIKVVINFLLS